MEEKTESKKMSFRLTPRDILHKSVKFMQETTEGKMIFFINFSNILHNSNQMYGYQQSVIRVYDQIDAESEEVCDAHLKMSSQEWDAMEVCDSGCKQPRLS